LIKVSRGPFLMPLLACFGAMQRRSGGGGEGDVTSGGRRKVRGGCVVGAAWDDAGPRPVEDWTPTATGARGGGLEISVVGRGRFVVTLLQCGRPASASAMAVDASRGRQEDSRPSA
jgi:hypothetical protein